ncbi:LIM/homeobox protein Lhx2 [Branchiostoma belcheri]|nr:LIM/homeobox protein Lhx2 [Branchiostoma belcheri]
MYPNAGPPPYHSTLQICQGNEGKHSVRHQKRVEVRKSSTANFLNIRGEEGRGKRWIVSLLSHTEFQPPWSQHAGLRVYVLFFPANSRRSRPLVYRLCLPRETAWRRTSGREPSFHEEPRMTMPVVNLDTKPGSIACGGCGEKIQDRFFLHAVDRQWHSACLKCCECDVRLDCELTCFSKDGRIYCREDYYRRFAVQRCGRCHLGITAREMVMRARDSVFHLACFTCVTCDKALTTGDEFGMQGSAIYCRYHYETFMRSDGRYGAAMGTKPLPHSPYYHSPAGVSYRGRPRKRGDSDSYCSVPANSRAVQPARLLTESHGDRLSEDTLPQRDFDGGRDESARAEFLGNLARTVHGRTASPAKEMVFKVRMSPSLPQSLSEESSNAFICRVLAEAGSSDNENDLDLDGHGGATKTKRIRTSFKHHQLRTLKSYFAINHNPDSKDLQQLAQKTGLTKRVLQVWFQNARAKHRRNALRLSDDGRDSGSGVGMDVAVSASPTSLSGPISTSSSPTLPDLSPRTTEAFSALTNSPGPNVEEVVDDNRSSRVSLQKSVSFILTSQSVLGTHGARSMGTQQYLLVPVIIPIITTWRHAPEMIMSKVSRGRTNNHWTTQATEPAHKDFSPRKRRTSKADLAGVSGRRRRVLVYGAPVWCRGI